jgi:hypothetical protein
VSAEVPGAPVNEIAATVPSLIEDPVFRRRSRVLTCRANAFDCTRRCLR